MPVIYHGKTDKPDIKSLHLWNYVPVLDSVQNSVIGDAFYDLKIEFDVNGGPIYDEKKQTFDLDPNKWSVWITADLEDSNLTNLRAILSKFERQINIWKGKLLYETVYETM